LGFPEIAPYYPNRLRNRVILGIFLVVVVVGVSVGVVLSKNGDGDANAGEGRTIASNETTAANETRAPSSSPVTLTERPTAGPTSLALTERPTAAPSTTSIVDQFLASLPAYSTDLAESDPDSPQAKALRWLENDPQYYNYRRVYRLNQRYAMAVLYYSTSGDSWNYTTGWLSNDNECSWYLDWYWETYYGDLSGSGGCGADSRLTVLALPSNNMLGSIPTEVELLTDLERFFLGDPELGEISGTIPTEM
jgi:hypothetical protein